MIVPITVNSRHYRIINTGIVCNVILREPKQGKKKKNYIMETRPKRIIRLTRNTNKT